MLLIGVGFTPLHAAGLSRIANTALVALGAIPRRSAAVVAADAGGDGTYNRAV